LGGLGGRNKGYFLGYGLAESISESARQTPNGGYVRENTGVRTVSFGLGSFSVGTSISRGGVWKPPLPRDSHHVAIVNEKNTSVL
jgi:hypothetical protein